MFFHWHYTTDNKKELWIDALIKSLFYESLMTLRKNSKLISRIRTKVCWWSFERHKSIYMFYRLFFIIKPEIKKRAQITRLNVYFMRDFDVKIKFKSLYNLLLISRVFSTFISITIIWIIFTANQCLNWRRPFFCYLSKVNLFFLFQFRMQIDEKELPNVERADKRGKKVDFNLFQNNNFWVLVFGGDDLRCD